MSKLMEFCTPPERARIQRVVKEVRIVGSDFILAVASAVAQALTGILGWVVTATAIESPTKKKVYGSLFIVATLLGVACTFIVAIRSPHPLTAQDVKSAVRDALPANLQNIPLSVAPPLSGRPTKADITQMVKEAIAAANSNPLYSYSNTRLNDETKAAVKDTDQLERAWISKLALERSETFDTIQFYKKKPDNSWEPMSPEQIKEENAKSAKRTEKINHDEQETSRNAVMRLCVLRAEDLTRLDAVGIKFQDKDIDSMCSQIKIINFSLNDLERVLASTSEIQKKLDFLLQQP
jgi:hypothetical protein